jgi:2-C-methyl-D-erythritol 4-phosphate cytidylyltransferase
LIPAAGIGSRFGDDLPKQYASIGAQPMIWHATRALLDEPRIVSVFVVLSPQDRWFSEIDWGDHADKVAALYCGGASRSASVHNGLVAMGDSAELDDWVLVHDAARPCLSVRDVRVLIEAIADDAVGGLLGVPVADTLKRASTAQRVDTTASRAGLWRALTPQMFRYGLLLRALGGESSLDPGITDESSAIERIGLNPRLVRGSSANIKVTLPEDLVVASRLVASGLLEGYGGSSQGEDAK